MQIEQFIARETVLKFDEPGPGKNAGAFFY
jgi:hypothetical protein